MSGEDGGVRIQIGFDEDVKSPALYFLASARGDRGERLGVVMGKTPVSHFVIITEPLLRIDPELRIDLVDRSGRLIYASYNPGGHRGRLGFRHPPASRANLTRPPEKT